MRSVCTVRSEKSLQTFPEYPIDFFRKLYRLFSDTLQTFPQYLRTNARTTQEQRFDCMGAPLRSHHTTDSFPSDLRLKQPHLLLNITNHSFQNPPDSVSPPHIFRFGIFRFASWCLTYRRSLSAVVDSSCSGIADVLEREKFGIDRWGVFALMVWLTLLVLIVLCTFVQDMRRNYNEETIYAQKIRAICRFVSSDDSRRVPSIL